MVGRRTGYQIDRGDAGDIVPSSELRMGDLFVFGGFGPGLSLGMFLRSYSYEGQGGEMRRWDVVIWLAGPRAQWTRNQHMQLNFIRLLSRYSDAVG